MSKYIRYILITVLVVFFSFGVLGCSAKDNGQGIDEPENPQENIKIYYNNPIYEDSAADPHIIKYEGIYYIFSTGGNIIKSTDLINWEKIEGGMNIARPTWGTSGANIWAPDVVKVGNKFMVYYSLSVWDDANPGVGVASADSPAGPWTDHGKLFLSKEIGVENSIDPGVFVDTDNRVYMVWGSFKGIFMVELTSDGKQLLGGINYAKTNKVLVAGIESNVWDGSTFEAPYIIKKDGYYYLFMSSGTCCEGLNSTYHVKVGRSTSIMGTYKDSNGNNMTNSNVGHLVIAGSSTLVGPGHNSVLIDDNGDYFLVYHVYKKVVENGQDVAKGRYLALDKLIWTNDGWCSVANQIPSRKAEAPKVS